MLRIFARRLVPIAAASLAVATPLAACTTSTSPAPARTASASARTVSAQQAAARSAPSPWHVVGQAGTFDGAEVNFAATSATDAWSTWVTTVSGAGSSPVTPQAVERWNGTAWQRVAVPASLVPHVRTSISVATDSASDAWIFSWKWPAEALRYTDGRWTLQQIPSWVIRRDADKRLGISSVAFSPANVWVFSLGIDSHKDHYAAHYNGRTWTKVTLPGIPGEVSVVSASDIWALDVSAGIVGSSWTASGVMHYNGRTWSLVRLPALPVAAGTSVDYSNLAAAGPDAAWLVRTVTSRSGLGATTLMHLSQAAWTTISFPSGAGPLIPLSTAQDGSGGLWIDGVYENPSGFLFTFHFSGGKWAQWGLGHSGDSMAWIPGTRQDWAWNTSGTIYRD
jgi:hypothetical protein